MMMNRNRKIKILLTNDDGIHSRELSLIADILKNDFEAEVFIVAPSKNYSGASVSFSHRGIIKARPHTWKQGIAAWSVDGTPVDCVKLAVGTLLKEHRFDFIVSGLNLGANVGRSALYSGTIGAAMEGAVKNIPSIAFSQMSPINQIDKRVLETYIPLMMKYIQDYPLPAGVSLNVNFPAVGLKEVAGIKFTKQGAGIFNEEVKNIGTEGADTLFKHIPGEKEEADPFLPCDTNFLKRNFVTVVPLQTFAGIVLPDLAEREQLLQEMAFQKNLAQQGKNDILSNS